MRWGPCSDAVVFHTLHVCTATWNETPMSKAKTVLEVRILSGARAGEQQLFFDAHELRLGRHPTADVLLPDPIVSRQHARIEGDAQNGFRIVDCGSTAGLYDVATGQKIAKIAVPATGSVEVAFGSPTSAPRCAVGLGSVCSVVKIFFIF